MKPCTTTYNVGILGATGIVGQRFVELLVDHPNFKVKALGASDRSIEQRYQCVVRGSLSERAATHIATMEVSPCTPDAFYQCDLVFSALDSSVAGEIESEFANHGYPVFSNAKNHRQDEDVPLLIPFVNPTHLQLIKQQKSFKQSGGYIVTNPNCSTTGLCIALHPLNEMYGISQMTVSTLQALSGAGYPGVPALDALDNVIPYIEGEEQKVENEPNKIFGTFDGQHITPASIQTSAACHRVCVTEGHMASVSIKLSKPPSISLVEDTINTLKSYNVPSNIANLHSTPERIIKVFDEPNRPQTSLDRLVGNGMMVAIGRVRRCPLMDIKMTVLSSNTILGAAGCSIANAELAMSEGMLHK